MNHPATFVGLALAGLLAAGFSACSDANAATAATPARTALPQPTGSVAAEEVATATTIRMGAIELVFLRQGLGARFAPWRRSERDGAVTSGVRVALGLVEPGPIGSKLTDDSTFAERSFWQLEPDSAQDLIAFVERLVGTRFCQRNRDVAFRQVHAQWGDMKFRMGEDGAIEVYVFTNQENTEIWSRFEPQLFVRSLTDAVERLQALRAQPQSVTMVR
ncbi:MAG: hypothetical protein IPK26_21270 [Planctomycetes bacterium]|nr:hypothetical protein [Planctomycetota bacterium]